MASEGPIWLTDGVFKAASVARTQKRLLFVCVADDIAAQGKQLADAMDSTEVNTLLLAHCVCVRLATGTDDERAFTDLVPAAQATPSVSIVHSAGNAVVCGRNITSTRLAAEIRTQLGATTRTTTHMGSLESIETERLRRLLVSRRRGDSQRAKQAVSAFHDDRRGYEYVHGPATALLAKNSKDVAQGRTRLLLRVSSGGAAVAEFDATAVFADVRAYVQRELGDAEIALAMPPRRTLTEDDDTRTLADLGLAPTAALLVRVAAVVQPVQKTKESSWPMTFGSALKPNEFGAVNGYTEKQLEVYGALTKLLAEKATAEREYGRKLVDLAQGFQQQLVALNETSSDSLALTDSEAEGSGPLELTSAVYEWTARLEEEGRLHVQVGAKTATDIADELRTAYEGLAEQRRRTLDGYQRLLAERDVAYDQKDKARAAYDAHSKALSASLQRQERALTEKDQDKLRLRADRDTALRNQSKNAYILHVATANAAKNAVNRLLTPRAMDAMQAVNDQRVDHTRRLLLQMLAMQQAADSRRAAATQRAASVVARVAPTADSDQLVRRRQSLSRWDEPPDFRVVVDAAAGDDEAVAKDGESQAILRNLALQALRDARRAEDEMAAADSDRDAAIAELHAIQHRALHAAVELHLGHAVANGSLHAFKPVTLALSKTCDYCAESIGGLNRKAARCAQCEYTCHAKCQIKVEPNCQGPDPDQKSGFLSMFGSKRGKKKSTERRHTRSASAVSEGSNNSANMSKSFASLPKHQLQLPMPDEPGTVAVLYDFAGDGATTLTVRATDRVRIVEPDTDASGWTAVELPSGLQGMVPTSYVDMKEYKPPPIQQQQHTPLLAIAAPRAEYVIALYDFAARDQDELSVTAGQRIQVVSRDVGDGWILCEEQGGGKQGRLPVAYVRNEEVEE
ncbi:Protein BZZ1 [Coemansia sp. BCRC 34301]|nr:Protein BZZ1 [Coemansia sp. BCRC 34301]